MDVVIVATNTIRAHTMRTQIRVGYIKPTRTAPALEEPLDARQSHKVPARDIEVLITSWHLWPANKPPAPARGGLFGRETLFPPQGGQPGYSGGLFARLGLNKSWSAMR